MPAEYVAIITDGNGRWAQQRELPVIEGHQAGADVVKARLRDAAEFGIKELTEERRKELVKIVHDIGEQGKVAVRNIRRDVMHDLRELKEAGDAGSDDEHRAEVELQKVTDGRISELDELLKHKEEEILEV